VKITWIYDISISHDNTGSVFSHQPLISSSRS